LKCTGSIGVCLAVTDWSCGDVAGRWVFDGVGVFWSP